MPPTLYHLQQIQNVLPPTLYPAIITAVAQGFLKLHQQQVQLAPVVHLGPFDATSTQLDDCCIKAGSVIDEEHFVVKIATGGFASNLSRQLPTADGLMVVFSQQTGQCEGILLDQGWLTDMRTAAAGAVAAKLLHPSRPVTRIGMIGTGIQARFQLLLLKRVQACRAVVLYGRNAARTLRAKKDIEAMGYSVTIVSDIQSLCLQCHFIITTTSSTTPLIMNDWVQPGTHITAVGADGIGKQELDPNILLRASIVVCDEISQCVAFGETSHAVKKGLLLNAEEQERRRTSDTNKIVSLGDLVLREKEGKRWARQKKHDITVFDSTGVAVQDVAIASLTLSLLKKKGTASKL